MSPAAPSTRAKSRDHLAADIQYPGVPSPLAPICYGIAKEYKEYMDFVQQQTAAELRVQAVARRYGRGERPANVTKEEWAERRKAISESELNDHLEKLRTPVRVLQTFREEHAAKLERLAKELPVYAKFVKQVAGVGALSLARIIGECKSHAGSGDLLEYSHPCKLWKRLGLAPFKGKSGKQWAIEGGLTKEEWVEFGYCRRRRSAIYVVGDGIIKAQLRKDKDDPKAPSHAIGPYGALYVARKEYERAKAPELPPVAHHLRAKRYMEKRFLKDLWRAWRDLTDRANQIQYVSSTHAATKNH